MPRKLGPKLILSLTVLIVLDGDRRAAYEIMRVIADKQGIDRIRMFNREGRLIFSTDTDQRTGVTSLSNFLRDNSRII